MEIIGELTVGDMQQRDEDNHKDDALLEVCAGIICAEVCWKSYLG